jgi:uncharacterized protein YkwD
VTAAAELFVGRMKSAHLLGIVLSLISLGASGQEVSQTPAERLASLVNEYRGEQSLHSIPISPSLTQVAEAHVKDLERNRPVGACNGHSWSPAGDWSACCYTADHAQAKCMWDKPREITRGAYKGAGFEIFYWTGGRATPEGALSSWKSSPGHHGVILNHGVWSTSRWQAVGVAISEHYAVIWFGQEPDPGVTR